MKRLKKAVNEYRVNAIRAACAKEKDFREKLNQRMLERFKVDTMREARRLYKKEYLSDPENKRRHKESEYARRRRRRQERRFKKTGKWFED